MTGINHVWERVTDAHIDATIAKAEYTLVPDTTLTICVLTLTNGFTVVGHQACADPAIFDADIGRRIARENAREQIWQLEGYLLKQRRHEAEQAKAKAPPYCGGGTTFGHGEFARCGQGNAPYQHPSVIYQCASCKLKDAGL